VGLSREEECVQHFNKLFPGKLPFEGLGRWEDNIKICRREFYFGDAECTEMAQRIPSDVVWWCDVDSSQFVCSFYMKVTGLFS
jgi:hypothetical protein